jgi:hypothetical protein
MPDLVKLAPGCEEESPRVNLLSLVLRGVTARVSAHLSRTLQTSLL